MDARRARNLLVYSREIGRFERARKRRDNNAELRGMHNPRKTKSEPSRAPQGPFWFSRPFNFCLCVRAFVVPPQAKHLHPAEWCPKGGGHVLCACAFVVARRRKSWRLQKTDLTARYYAKSAPPILEIKMHLCPQVLKTINYGRLNGHNKPPEKGKSQEPLRAESRQFPPPHNQRKSCTVHCRPSRLDSGRGIAKQEASLPIWCSVRLPLGPLDSNVLWEVLT